jgi:hypothetical protein
VIDQVGDSGNEMLERAAEASQVPDHQGIRGQVLASSIYLTSLAFWHCSWYVGSIGKQVFVIKKQKSGASRHSFRVIEWLIVCLVLVILAGVGVAVYQHTRVTGTGAWGTAQVPRQQPAIADPYTGWKKYTSTLGGFSLHYPARWELSGFQGINPVLANEMNGQETLIRLQSKPNAKGDDFGIDMYVSTGAYSTPYNTYGNGTTTKLSNGITIWQEKEQENYATGPAIDACPALRVGTDGTFSQQLPTGKYLSFYGSFCWSQNETTDKTYAQQVASPEWAAATGIVKSIRST